MYRATPASVPGFAIAGGPPRARNASLIAAAPRYAARDISLRWRGSHGSSFAASAGTSSAAGRSPRRTNAARPRQPTPKALSAATLWT